VWRFAIKHAVLRPVGSANFPVLPAPVWNPGSIYQIGAIVNWQGTNWISTLANNLNNTPGVTGWSLYSGSSLPQPPTMFLAPGLWSGSTTYFPGAIVEDSAGSLWFSMQPDNLNNQPGTSSAWDLYFGTMTATPFDTSGATAYYAGDVVYEFPGTGTYTAYLSLQNSNSTDPSVTNAWSSTITYRKDQVVSYLSSNYMSLVDLNLAQVPSSAPALWAIGTTYATNALVGASDGYIYKSVGSGNVGNNPVTDLGVHWTNTGVLNPWTTVFTQGLGSNQWLQLGVGLTDLFFAYPIGTGPSNESATRNVYRLPANFLRRAPQDPKAGSTSFLGAPTGLMYDDWDLEGDFIVTRQSDPIVFRFVADMVNVNAFDPMFFEGLAARIAIEVCETITQSTDKLSKAEGAYGKFMTEARVVNGIETGPTEPPEDDWITCRI
jgi:hypothetical protein